MKTAILYATVTGSSKKIAKAIGDKIKVTPRNVKDNPEPGVVDTLIIVSGVYMGKSKKELVDYVGALHMNQVKRAIVVTTSGAGQNRTSPAEVVQVLKRKGIPVLGEFNVRGKAFIIPTGHPSLKDLSEITQWVINMLKR